MAPNDSRQHPQMGAVRRLSYPAIRAACAPRYHRFQISPCRLTEVTFDAAAHVSGIGSTVSRRPEAVLTRPFGRFRFRFTQGCSSCLETRVRVAQPHLTDWVEGSWQPPAPVATQRALLEALRDGR